MSGRNYFDSSFIGRQITFDTPAPTTWVLAEKVKEDVNQLTHDGFLSGVGASYAIASFNCSNRDNPAQQALMRVYMQIPSKGTEFDSSSHRAEQVSDKLSFRARTEWECLRRLTAANNENIPTLLHSGQVTQDNEGLVPGGYILCMALNRAPGVCLDSRVEGRPRKSFFWSMSSEDHERVRQEFKNAYIPAMAATEDLAEATTENYTNFTQGEPNIAPVKDKNLKAITCHPFGLQEWKNVFSNCVRDTKRFLKTKPEKKWTPGMPMTWSQSNTTEWPFSRGLDDPETTMSPNYTKVDDLQVSRLIVSAYSSKKLKNTLKIEYKHDFDANGAPRRTRMLAAIRTKTIV
ncbi:uncharacterized protein KD926_011267 [Aspergillus affinis]|uniref:uncharacterized protein n=1 Tax=Aspergillus affinis TaxID=1070780 RepID=UPI0022FF0163|nr:uncharacterized protein KD926_011267 [Aspergillus affinis]KAI9038133.1 hypothetical protein KD926_011267 [Aspergillus affinis]